MVSPRSFQVDMQPRPGHAYAGPENPLTGAVMATSIRLDTTALERARWVAKNYGLHLSKTTIRTFRACPKAYRLEKIDRLPGSAEATAAQARGTAVHAALEAILRHVGDQEVDAVVEEA